jgi:hypothetical protein
MLRCRCWRSAMGDAQKIGHAWQRACICAVKTARRNPTSPRHWYCDICAQSNDMYFCLCIGVSEPEAGACERQRQRHTVTGRALRSERPKLRQSAAATIRR